jgi:hypothetical protein
MSQRACRQDELIDGELPSRKINLTLARARARALKESSSTFDVLMKSVSLYICSYVNLFRMPNVGVALLIFGM